jgi:GNAT superfamily N-acetyltransferase
MFKNYHRDYKTEHQDVILIERRYGFVSYKLDSSTKTLCLMELYVAPKYRGKGYAEKFLEQLQQVAKEHKARRFITTIDTNDKGSRLLLRALKAVGMKKLDQTIKVEFDLYSQEVR